MRLGNAHVHAHAPRQVMRRETRADLGLPHAPSDQWIRGPRLAGLGADSRPDLRPTVHKLNLSETQRDMRGGRLVCVFFFVASIAHS
jgi:hypothetical protein